MTAISSSPRYGFAGRRQLRTRLGLGAVVIALVLLNMKVVEIAVASGAKQPVEAIPFNIHPLCLRGVIGAFDSSGPDEVEVTADTLIQCEDAKIKVEARKNGAFAYDSNDTRLEGYTGYTIMGDLSAGNGLVFRYEFSGGGTGRFTSLWWLEGELTGGANMVRISFLDGTGDRCNGYISSAEIIESPTGDDLVVERLITPYIFIVEGDDLPSSLRSIEPYSDLADCAVCCTGTMINRRPISDKTADRIVSFEISKSSSWTQAINDQGRLQACFNKLVDEQSDGKERLSLSVEEADRFREVFAKNCIRE